MSDDTVTIIACSVAGCSRTRRYVRSGLCTMHAARVAHHGSVGPAAPSRGRNTGPCGAPQCDRLAKSRGYCARHYARLYRYGDPTTLRKAPNGVYTGAPCQVEGCTGSATTQGYCNAHYARWRRHGTPHGGRITPTGCTVAGCERPYASRGFCQPHYSRWRAYGDPLGTPAPHVPKRSRTSRGYISVLVKGHPNANKRGRVQEHRVVMAQMLGRALLPTENVHHRNGDKTDNAPENLELWVRTQPCGQRAHDLVAWAREILARYGSYVDGHEQ